MSEVRTNSITDAAGTGAPDFPNGINAATALIAKVDDTERMRIDSAGNVGIGTAAPAPIGTSVTTLDIEGSLGGGIRFERTSATASEGYLGAFSGEFRLASLGAIPVTFRTDNTERMRIDSSGNVGIGTSSPTAGYRLDVFGQAQIGDGGGNADINFNASSTGRFLVAGTERLRVASAGQIGIGGANYGTSGQVLTSGGSGAAPSWASVGTAIAGFTTASVGAYAFCNNQSGATINESATVAGSSLRLSDSRDVSGSALAGTWRNMGKSIVTGGPATLFLRIS